MQIGISLSLTGRLRGGASILALLFANNEQGLALVILPKYLYQDAAGTTPVTSPGDPVGLVMDQSGNGNHVSQTADAKRPTYQVDGDGRGYLQFDGVDDFLQTAPIDFTGSDEMTVCAGVRKLSDADAGILVELSEGTGVNAGAFLLSAPNSSAGNYGGSARGSTLSPSIVASGYNAPTTNTVTLLSRISGPSQSLRVDGQDSAASAADIGTGTFGNYSLYIGMRGGINLPASVNIYGLVVRGKMTTGTPLARLEQDLATKSGVTL